MASEQSFQDLMARVRAGDSDAVSELIARYGDAILRAARMRMFNSRARRAFGSEDVFQSVIKSFCLRYAREDNNWQIDTPGDLANLLAKMAKNKAISKTRHEMAPSHGGDRPLEPIDETVQIPGNAPRPDDVAVLKEEYERCWNLFDQDARDLYRLRIDDKLSWAEIGKKLGTSGDACRKKLERILDEVRKKANSSLAEPADKPREERHE